MLGRVVNGERGEERTFAREPTLLSTMPIRLGEIVKYRLD